MPKGWAASGRTPWSPIGRIAIQPLKNVVRYPKWHEALRKVKPLVLAVNKPVGSQTTSSASCQHVTAKAPRQSISTCHRKTDSRLVSQETQRLSRAT
jgi:hypothetical protein